MWLSLTFNMITSFIRRAAPTCLHLHFNMAVHSKDVLDAIETIQNSDALQSLQQLKDHTTYITQHSTTLPREEEERKTRGTHTRTYHFLFTRTVTLIQH